MNTYLPPLALYFIINNMFFNPFSQYGVELYHNHKKRNLYAKYVIFYEENLYKACLLAKVSTKQREKTIKIYFEGEAYDE